MATNKFKKWSVVKVKVTEACYKEAQVAYE